MGKCVALIAYAQLIVENAILTGLSVSEVDAIFELLVNDLSALALTLAAFPLCDDTGRKVVKKMIAVPTCAIEGWKALSNRVAVFGNASDG